MIDFEFEYEPHSGIAEALDAAGVDAHVPWHDDLRAGCEDAWEAVSVDDVPAMLADPCVSSAHAVAAQAPSEAIA